MAETLAETLAEAVAAARACRLCADLPLGPRPVVRASATARLLIVGQAPGTAVHASGIPWDDPSGERLRDWLGLTPEVFHDEARVAIVPMGLCYPGRLAAGGDAAPRAICSPTWHPRLLPLLSSVRLTLAIGGYAIRRLIGPGGMTGHVANWRAHGAAMIPLPHPSWRTIGWEKRNPWFARELLPCLRARLGEIEV